MKVLPLLVLALFMACPGGEMNQEVELPEIIKTDKSIEECLALRRSVRDFTADTLTYEQVSTLLWAAQGVTDSARGFRTAPSAGATYPLETYVIVEHGIFLYNPSEHKVSLVSAGDYRGSLAKACFGQSCVVKAPCSIVICAVPERTAGRYGDRAMRYIWIEAGHAAQNIHLQAVALGLGSVPVGAFSDDAVSVLLGLGNAEKRTIPLYVIPVGVPVTETTETEEQE